MLMDSTEVMLAQHYADGVKPKKQTANADLMTELLNSTKKALMKNIKCGLWIIGN